MTSKETVTAKDLETFGLGVIEQIHNYASRPQYPDYATIKGDRQAGTTWHIQNSTYELDITSTGRVFELPDSPWKENRLKISAVQAEDTIWSTGTLLGFNTGNPAQMRLEEECESKGLFEILGVTNIEGVLGTIHDQLDTATVTKWRFASMSRQKLGSFSIHEKSGTKAYGDEVHSYAEQSLSLRDPSNMWLKVKYVKIPEDDRWSLFDVSLTDLSPGRQPRPPFPFYREHLESLQVLSGTLIEAAMDLREGEQRGRKGESLPDGSSAHFAYGYQRGQELRPGHG